METVAVPGRRAARIGGIVLLVLGLSLAAIGVMAAAADPVEGISIGPAIAMFALALAAPPLIAALGILRHQRWASVLGIVVGVPYGALFLALGARGTSPLPIIGLGFLGAAIALLDSFRRGASR